jgi:hypothetical protein
MRPTQLFNLRRRYRIIMWDVVTRDYSPHMTAQGVFNVVKRYTRNGSIIVFHDSLKALDRLREALPLSIEWLQSQGYRFAQLLRISAYTTKDIGCCFSRADFSISFFLRISALTG